MTYGGSGYDKYVIVTDTNQRGRRAGYQERKERLSLGVEDGDETEDGEDDTKDEDDPAGNHEAEVSLVVTAEEERGGHVR